MFTDAAVCQQQKERLLSTTNDDVNPFFREIDYADGLLSNIANYNKVNQT